MKIEIRQETMSPIFEKYHLEGLPFDAVIHKFTAPDEGHPHDHPFNFHTHILKGWYAERIYNLDGTFRDVVRKEGESHFVSADTVHQIIALSQGECYTIITPQEKVKEPCFWKFENGLAYRRQWNEEEFKIVMKEHNPTDKFQIDTKIYTRSNNLILFEGRMRTFDVEGGNWVNFKSYKIPEKDGVQGTELPRSIITQNNKIVKVVW